VGVTPNFDGEDDLVFTGEGEDFVDLTTANSNSRVDGGNSNDQLVASSNDRLFGGAGDDTLEASLGNGNNHGRVGDDLFILGSSDRAQKEERQ
jgi:glycerophosphoryl diester phosphodiesterase